MGEIALAIDNAETGTEAIWLEVLPTPGQGDGSDPTLSLGLPPIITRLERGASVTLPIRYIRGNALNSPGPSKRNIVLAVRHAHDGGTMLEVPIALPFRSANVVMNAGDPKPVGVGLTVPITLLNAGDANTGEELEVSASFVLPSGQRVVSEFNTRYDGGLPLRTKQEFSLKVPVAAQRATWFLVRLNVQEGFAAGTTRGSPQTGFPSHWSLQSARLSPPIPWLLYSGLAFCVLLLMAAIHAARVYGDPIVRAVSREPTLLLRLPLDALPRASRALARARRLGTTLGRLDVSERRWQAVLTAVASPNDAAPLAHAIRARIVASADPGPLLQIELPATMRIRFGPHVSLVAVGETRVDQAEAHAIVEHARRVGSQAVIAIDRSDAQTAKTAFADVAGTTVVLSSDALRDVLLAPEPRHALELVIAQQRPRKDLTPYRVAGGVQAEALFFGRENELRNLADRDLQNAVIVGARQTGKSSLLKALTRRLRSRANVDAHYVALHDHDLIGSVAAYLGVPRPSTPTEFQEIVRGESGMRRVWLIDEADAFAASELAGEGAVLWAMRALAEGSDTRFVLAGFWDLYRGAVFDAQSPLRNFGEVVRLGPLDRDAAKRLVREPMSALGVAVEDSAVEALLYETGCRASLLVLACQGLLEVFSADRSVVTRDDIERVWADHAGPLQSALMYWKEDPFDTMIGHAALSLTRASRAQIENVIETHGANLTSAQLDASFERLQLHFALVPEFDSESGLEHWVCPTPLIARFERRIRPWAEHLEHDVAELRLIHWSAATGEEAAGGVVNAIRARVLSRSGPWPLIQIELPSLLRFGPRVALVELGGARVKPPDARAIAEHARGLEIAHVIAIDRSDSQNGRAAFAEVASTFVIVPSDTLRNLLRAPDPLRALEVVIAQQRPRKDVSPYRVAGGVQVEALFFGREQELRNLADRDLQNAVIVGARQMGKSSLLKALARRLGSRSNVDAHYVVLHDHDLIGSLAAHLDVPRPTTLTEFQKLARGEPGKPRVWLIDEADAFAASELAGEGARRGAVLWAMRALAEGSETRFVLAGFWDLYRGAVFDAQSPLRNFGEVVRLGPLERDAAKRLVREPMSALGVAVEDPAVEALLNETGCRANLLVLACQGLLEVLSTERSVVTRDDVERVWADHAGPLQSALMYWKEDPFDTMIGHAALSLTRGTRTQLEEVLETNGANITRAQLDASLERLQLHYALVPELDSGSGLEHWMCPVPLIARFERRIRPWTEHLEHDVAELRRVRVVPEAVGGG
jgi:hypothetical protein